MCGNEGPRSRGAKRLRSTGSALKSRLRKYFSGRLAVVQITAGVGAFVVRTGAAYLASDLSVAVMVYIGAYAFGYWLVFRKDYKASGRSMPLDIARLQLVEQLPNVGTAVAAGLTQGVLIGGVDMEPVVAVNVASWFGPQKIVNFAAMLTSNSLKKAWVDGTWKPLGFARNLVRRVRGAGG
jgi:hypothetical protein